MPSINWIISFLLGLLTFISTLLIMDKYIILVKIMNTWQKILITLEEQLFLIKLYWNLAFIF